MTQKQFSILELDRSLNTEIQDKINQKTKPLNSLGKLEEYALKIALIQKNTSPKLSNPTMLIFAGDHGLAKEGISPFPQEVTYQMVLNFLQGGAAINSFCIENRMHLKVIDAGVNYEFGEVSGLISAKVNFGTKNLMQEQAMSLEECNLCIERGAAVVREVFENGCNTVGFGEMGIGNTGISSLLISKILDLPLEDLVGRGTGSNDTELKSKLKILETVSEKYSTSKDPLEILSTFGGFEIAMIVGGILQAAELQMVILIDGFIVSTACLIASKISKSILDYCFYSHLSSEKAHSTVLKNLNADPILNLGMRLGEGTGAALCYPILATSVRFLNDMASFSEASVSNKE